MVPHAWFDLSFVDLGWFDSESVLWFRRRLFLKRRSCAAAARWSSSHRTRISHAMAKSPVDLNFLNIRWLHCALKLFWKPHIFAVFQNCHFKCTSSFNNIGIYVGFCSVHAINRGAISIFDRLWITPCGALSSFKRFNPNFMNCRFPVKPATWEIENVTLQPLWILSCWY